jgi:cation/acetate symporter
MTPDEKTSEIRIDKDIIVLSTPEVAQLAPWVIALVAAGGLAAALSTASGLLLVISSSIAHDLYYRLINPKASEKKRVLVGRIMILFAVLVAGFFGIHPMGFVAQVVAFAFGLAAASFFPVIVLGIFDKRTNRAGAIAGMLVGLGFTTFYITAIKFLGMSPWLGISAEGIGTVGMLLNFAVTLAVSRMTAPPPQEIQDMVEAIRSPDHAALAAILDEDSEEFH